jgi:hypothetical protein
LAIRLLSVKTCECGIDPDGRAQRAWEGPLGGGALEADEPWTGVRAAACDLAARDELAVAGCEAQELCLGRAPAAADAAPDRLGH